MPLNILGRKTCQKGTHAANIEKSCYACSTRIKRLEDEVESYYKGKGKLDLVLEWSRVEYALIFQFCTENKESREYCSKRNIRPFNKQQKNH